MEGACFSLESHFGEQGLKEPHRQKETAQSSENEQSSLPKVLISWPNPSFAGQYSSSKSFFSFFNLQQGPVGDRNVAETQLGAEKHQEP